MQEMNNGAKQHATVAWISHEAKALTSVAGRLKSALIRLDKKTSGGRIHDARTALKRWNAVWSALVHDGWTLDDDVIDALKTLFKTLGNARDYDVYLKEAEELNISKGLVSEWKSERKHARKQLESKLKKVDVAQVCDALDKLMEREPSVMMAHMAQSVSANESSKHHVDFILHQQEQRVYKAVLAPAAPEDYHAARKEVKNWLYLVEELSQTQHQRLKDVEQKLGDLHDLDKLEPLLLGDKENLSALGNLQTKREQLLSHFEDLKRQLPLRYNSSAT